MLIDAPAVGPQAELSLAMNQIAGGNSPTAMQWQSGRAGAQTRAIRPAGDWPAGAGPWKQHLPLIVLQNITVDAGLRAIFAGR